MPDNQCSPAPNYAPSYYPICRCGRMQVRAGLAPHHLIWVWPLAADCLPAYRVSCEQSALNPHLARVHADLALTGDS